MTRKSVKSRSQMVNAIRLIRSSRVIWIPSDQMVVNEEMVILLESLYGYAIIFIIAFYPFLLRWQLDWRIEFPIIPGSTGWWGAFTASIKELIRKVDSFHADRERKDDEEWKDGRRKRLTKNYLHIKLYTLAIMYRESARIRGADRLLGVRSTLL